MRWTVRTAALPLLAMALATPLRAQGYFGTNQVQYDRFHWEVLETPHFLIHYYPEEQEGLMDAARMAERSYARLSRLLNHEFLEKKPIILYRSRGDFAQNNVTGDLGEGTGGVTEALRHRVLLPFTGDYKSFEHVLTHELVHAFQYDIFARGRAGNGLQTLAQVQPPIWFMEGMAEYLSMGPGHVLTQAWIRDACLNGTLPSIKQMTEQPERFFPYRFGEALWEYIGGRWGDDVIGQIMNAVPNVGIERAFKREIGVGLDELSDEWREDMQVKHLPQIAHLERARKFSQPLLTQRRSGGFADTFVEPALSPDGKLITFIAQGDFLRGQVFFDLWLGDAETGRRLGRLVKSTTSSDYEELRLLYSQSSFSPDGKLLAFTAQRDGRDVLYVLDVKKRKTIKRFDTGLEWVTSPTWSPDGKQIAVSGSSSGITDLYIVDYDTGKLHQLMNDKFGDMQPAWSPDGKTIAFATEREDEADFDELRLRYWRIATLDLATGKVTVIPGQDGLNLNPQWAPDGKSLAFISDRTGIANIFLYDFGTKEHYQLTNVMGSVSGITEYSPAITWAHKADKLAFTYYEDGEYTIWMTRNPRRLKGEPFRPKVPAKVVAEAKPGVPAPQQSTQQRASDLLKALDLANGGGDSGSTGTGGQSSLYRSPGGIRPSADLPGGAERVGVSPVSVAALLDSASMALPDTTQFVEYPYRVGFSPEAVERPTIGYAQDNYNQGLYGGAGVLLSDMLGNNQIMLAGSVNGRLDDAFFFAGYTNLASRLQYSVGVAQTPIYFQSGGGPVTDANGNLVQYRIDLSRYVLRQAFAIAMRPSNRFNRWEAGVTANSVNRSIVSLVSDVDPVYGYAYGLRVDGITNLGTLSYVSPYLAYVGDNSLMGYTGPIAGRRYRIQISPTLGGLRWMDYSLDYRRYVPLLFDFLTFAWRFQTDLAIGRDEAAFPKYLARADYVRGYDREQYLAQLCGGLFSDTFGCSATDLLGSRIAMASAELRFPLVRRFDLGVLPLSLPPVDGLFFYDAGIAWTSGQQVSLRRPVDYDPDTQRFPLRSYGFGLRLNLFNIALMRWDYAIPLDYYPHRGHWIWTLGESF